MSSVQGDPYLLSASLEQNDLYDYYPFPVRPNATSFDPLIQNALQPTPFIPCGVQNQYIHQSQALRSPVSVQQPPGSWDYPQVQQASIAPFAGGYGINNQSDSALSPAVAAYHQEPTTVAPAHLSLPVTTPNGTNRHKPLTWQAQAPAYGHHPPVVNQGHGVPDHAAQVRRTSRHADGHASARSAQKPTSTKRPRATVTNQGSDHKEVSTEHICSLCSQPCSRLQELKRHIREIHLPWTLLCLEPGCSWGGHRDNLLQKHLTNLHPYTSPRCARGIYPADQLVESLIDGKITIEAACDHAAIGYLQARLWTRLPPDLRGA
ncbi:hypothetical protein BC834DRAFT_969146 [Gloeopeniophorella convolvens]|nr:hypothetical protein BC834DRAFT_969146 [Gloeopeniophorella convolvens]